MNVLLHSQLLQFSSDGAVLACAAATSVTLVDTQAKRAPLQIEHHRAAALAAFPGQVWILDEQRRLLHRFHADGQPLGAPRALASAPCTQWLVAMSGVPAVLVQGAKRQLLVGEFGDSDTLSEKDLPAAGVAFPLVGRRHVFCSVECHVLLGGGATFPLAAGITVLGGAALQEAKSVVLIVADPRGRCGTVVVETSTARVQQQRELVGAERMEMRLAAQRAMLVVRTSERRFAIVDLVPGTVFDFVESPAEVDDFAVDPTAKRIAIRSGDAVRVYALRQLSASAQPELEIALDAPVVPPHARPAVVRTSSLAASASGARQTPHPVVEPVAMVAGVPSPPPSQVSPPPAKSPETPTSESAAGRWFDALSIRDLPSMPRASSSSEQPPPPSTSTSMQPASTVTDGTGRSDTPALATTVTNAHRTAEETERSSTFDRAERATRDVPADAARAPIVELYKFRSNSSPRSLIAPRREDARTARAILEAQAERIFQRAVHAHAQLDGTTDSADAPLVQADSDERGPMAQLARALGLDALTCDFVWSVVACSYDPRIARHLEALIGASGRRGLSVSAYALMTEIDASRGLDLARWLDAPGNPLVSTGLLVATEPASPADRAYVASSRLVSYLAGEDVPAAPIRVVRADRPLIYDDHQTAAIDEIAAALGRSPDPLIVVEGPLGSGRTTACARASRRDLLVLDLRHVASHELPDALMALRRETLLHPGIPVLANIEHLLGEDQRELRKTLGAFVDKVAGPLVVTATLAGTDLGSERPGVRIRWQVPNSSVRAQLWDAAVRAIGAVPAGDLSAVAYRYRVGPAVIERAVASVRLFLPPGAPVDDSALAAGLRHNIAERLGSLARRVDVTQTWDDLVVSDDIADRLREIVGRGRHAHQVLERWGYRKRMALGTGMAVLFSGPPGTGKTMVAGLIARELDLELYVVDLSKVVSKWIGETEKNLARVFDAAEEGHALLLFDEADSLFGQRSTDMKSAVDRYANLEVNYLLQRIEAFGGITVLTTNLETAIDDAVMRRLAAHVRFDKPDEEQRARLWEHQCITGQAPIARDVNYQQLARMFPNMTGANIRNAAISAAYIAAGEGAPAITQAHLVRAGRAEYASMGHVLADMRSSNPGSSL